MGAAFSVEHNLNSPPSVSPCLRFTQTRTELKLKIQPRD